MTSQISFVNYKALFAIHDQWKIIGNTEYFLL